MKKNSGQDAMNFKTAAFFGEPFRSAFQYFGDAGIEKTFNKRISIGADIGFSANAFDLDFGASEKYPRVSPIYLQYLIDLQTNPDLLPPPFLDPGKGFRFGYEFGINLQPTDPFNLSFSYERTKLTRNDTKLTCL